MAGPYARRAVVVAAGAGSRRALVDVLLGITEPSGRLRWTLPAAESDVPVRSTLPVAGVIDYAECIHVGYREWDLLNRTPAREFGYGLGYGSWRYEQLEVTGQPGSLTANVTVTNVGARDARETIQLYLETPDSVIDRPVRWLAAFGTVDIPAGQRRK